MSLLQKDDAPLHAEAEREKMADLGVVFKAIFLFQSSWSFNQNSFHCFLAMQIVLICFLHL
jgi:hypothetical protein